MFCPYNFRAKTHGVGSIRIRRTNIFKVLIKMEDLKYVIFIITETLGLDIDQVKQDPVQCQCQLFTPNNASVIGRYPNSRS